VVADVEIPHPFMILKKLAWALRKSQTKARETSLDAKEAAGTINTVKTLLACLPPCASRWSWGWRETWHCTGDANRKEREVIL
jgi:hypothetical protein